MIGALKGFNKIETEIVGLIRQTMSNALKTSGAVATVGAEMTKVAVNDTIQ